MMTVGTTLQNGNFVIEAILHQSDFGVTYQAAHPLINRPMILQSFNEVLRQRSDFDQLRQKFLQEVLLFSKQPSDMVQVIDCFEENGMPFIVLESVADQSIPPLSSWLEIPVEAPAQEIAQPAINTEALALAPATAFPEALPEATVIAAPIAPAPIAEVRTEEVAIAIAEDPTPVPVEPVAAPFPVLQSLPSDYATNGSKKGVKVLVSQSLKPKKWMPIALMMTALIAGFGGAGLGLALRFKPTPPQDNASSLNSGWFGQEQSFPPQQEWPITETPDLSPSSASEQPYQSSPSVGSDIPRVQPSTDYIPPELPPSDYQPALPGIADYPPPDPVSPVAPVVEPSAPEVTQPIIPPQPIVPDASPETVPEISKPPASAPKDVPADAPIFRQ